MPKSDAGPRRCYRPFRSRCLQPGQQQGRRWPSSSSSCVRRTRRSRVVGCLASSTQQMNSLRANGVMSFQASSAVVFAINASRRSPGNGCTTPPGTGWLLTGKTVAMLSTRPEPAGAFDERLQLRPRHVARQVLHPTVGGNLQALDRDVLQGRLDAALYLVGRLRRCVVREVEHAEDDRLARQVLEHREVELRLGRLDCDLIGGAVVELREERVSRRAVVDYVGVAEAGVEGSRALDPFKRAVDRREGVLAGLIGA